MEKSGKLQIGYYDLLSYSAGTRTSPGASNRDEIMGTFKFETDISFLFPFINAVVKQAQLYENPSMIRFEFHGVVCVLYPETCVASPFNDKIEVTGFAEELIRFLKGIDDKKHTIVPKYKVFQHTDVTKILKLLPGTNCKECGHKTCLAFAAMLSRQQVLPSKCPYLGSPVHEQVTYPVYDDKGNRISCVTIDVDTTKPETPGTDPEDSNTPRSRQDSESTTADIESANRCLPSPLTRRELEVLSMMARGLTNNNISKQLFISPHTVKSHVIHIFNKLGVNHRTQAVVWAVQNGLL